MMKKIFFILAVFSFSLIHAQVSIKGKVTDKNKNGIPGAVVYIQKLHKGVMTSSSGNFVITNVLVKNFDVSVSLIGYQTKIIHVNSTNINNDINVVLEQQVFETQEVIISGNKFSLQHENAVDIKSVKLGLQADLETNFLQSLSKQSGVDMISKGNGLQKPVIRGLSNTNILVVDNGIRKENFQFSENHPYLIDDNGVDRIEIIKGPASLMYGSDAVGGVIFLLPEKPALQNSIQGNYKAKYSLNDGGFATSIGIKGAKTNFHSGVNFSYKTFQDFFDANNVQVKNSRFNNISAKANAGYSYKFGKSDIYFDYNKMKIGMTVPLALSLINENSYTNELWFQNLDSKIIALKNKLFFNLLMVDANFSYQANRRKLFTNDFLPVDMNLSTIGYNVKGTYSIRSNSQVIVGLQGILQTNKNFEAPNHVIPNASLNDFGLYGMYSYKYHEKLNILVGLRFDYRKILTLAELNKPAVNKDFKDLSFSLGATYKISNDLLLRTNFASAHRTPNIAELTQNGVHGAIFEKGNSNLKKQVNFEPDLSLHYHNNFFLFDASTYYNKINDYIFLGNTGLLNEKGMKIYQYQQTDAIIKGVELGFKIMPIKQVKLFANYSYINAQQNNGKYLPFIPHNKIHSEIKYLPSKKIFNFKITSTLNFVYAFKQNHFSEFETETPEYFVSDFSLNFERNIKKSKINIAFKISNLFNETYVDHLSTIKDLGFYSQGRNIIAVVKYVF